MAGLGGGMSAFLVLGIIGFVDSPSDSVALLFLQFLALVGSGYVAGRFAGREPVRHGGYAGLLVFMVSSGITLAADPGSGDLLVIAFTGLVAVALGSAGGVLIGVRRE
jgi:hypothetical protein